MSAINICFHMVRQLIESRVTLSNRTFCNDEIFYVYAVQYGSH